MKKIKQIAAIIMCVILVGMYVASFIAAIFAKPQAHGLFMGRRMVFLWEVLV
ncbi:unknown [Clostridium sp. CAG:253]|nr:unknown [Clostridium sp. CAG:253]